MWRNLKLHWRRFRNVEVMSIRGVKIRTVQDEIPRFVRSMVFKGSYESHECDLVERTVRPNESVLEIGSGIGLVGLVATRICGEGNALCCEANPKLESVIRENYRLNGWRANLSMRAVTSDGRDVALFCHDNVLSSSTLNRSLRSDRIVVESHVINDLIDMDRPSVVIMDVEGSEVELLRAADISNVRAVIVEMHPHIVGEENIDLVICEMEAKGFRVTDVYHKTYLLIR